MQTGTNSVQGNVTATVEPLLSGHPWGNGKWQLNRGWPLKRGSSEISKKSMAEMSTIQSCTCRRTITATAKRCPRPLNGGDHLTGVFYSI